MIAKLTKSVHQYNSVTQGSVREIDVHKAIQLRSELKACLIDLKLKLQVACQPIQRDILMTSELKDELSFYHKMDGKHGKIVSYNYGSSNEVHFEAIIRQVDIDRRCLELQRELDALYSKIDGFNTSHFIEIEEIADERLVGTGAYHASESANDRQYGGASLILDDEFTEGF